MAYRLTSPTATRGLVAESNAYWIKRLEEQRSGLLLEPDSPPHAAPVTAPLPPVPVISRTLSKVQKVGDG